MYDTLIIGSGPAGMTAALYAARSNLKVGLLERGIYGGQMNNTADIENYPGYELISGPELAEKMYEPLEKFGVEHLFGQVVEVQVEGSVKKVITEDDTFEAKTVILAMGAQHRPLGAPGEAEFNSRGVSYQVEGSVKKVITEDDTFEAKTVILAMGAQHRPLGAPGEAEFNSRGVSYCAVCDGL